MLLVIFRKKLSEKFKFDILYDIPPNVWRRNIFSWKHGRKQNFWNETTDLMNQTVEDNLKVRINSYHAVTLFVNVEDLLSVISQIRLKPM